jgi:DNA-binding MarR family transcriptional regulator
LKNLSKLIEDLYEMCDNSLPLNNSFIPLLILAKTIRHEATGSDLTLKKLCAELKSSDLCTRTHVSKLEKKEWLKLVDSTKDRRVKIVKSTPKLEATFQKLSKEILHRL